MPKRGIIGTAPGFKTYLDNTLGFQEIIPIFAESNRERLSNSADSNVHRALFPERVIMLFLSLKADDVANLAEGRS